jgi:antirestriction protein ArdC
MWRREIYQSRYVAHWVSRLRDDKKEIFRAAADAQPIAGYLRSFHPAFATSDAESDTQPRNDRRLLTNTCLL